MNNYLQSAEQVIQRIGELAYFRDQEHTTKREFGKHAFVEAGKKVLQWMQEIGLQTQIDKVGNIHGRLSSSEPAAKTLIIGSHLDNDQHSGKYESGIGIAMALELVKRIVDHNKSLPFHVEIIVFGTSTGTRFNCPAIGSRALAGLFKNRFLHLQDADGISFSEVLKSFGQDTEKIKENSLNPETLLGYFEIQMEPELFLNEQEMPVGLVSSLLGEKRIEIEFIGKNALGGITPMDMRKDALAAAAKFILAVEKYAFSEKRLLRTTVGKIHITDPVAHQVPGKVTCTVEMKGDDEALLSEAYEDFYSSCEKICDKRNIYYEWKLIEETNPVACNKKWKKVFTSLTAEKNIRFGNIEKASASDAVVMGAITPVTVLQLRSAKALKRTDERTIEAADIALALELSEKFLTLSPEKALKKLTA